MRNYMKVLISKINIPDSLITKCTTKNKLESLKLFNFKLTKNFFKTLVHNRDINSIL